jgi:uncharacterized cupin superfamily protein
MSVPPEQLLATEEEMPAGVQKPTGTEGQTESLRLLWTDEAGRVAGVWECTPGTFTSSKTGLAEISQILSGRATVTSSDGSVTELSPGVLLVLPDGWAGSWQIHQTLRKSFVIIPAATTPRA